MSSRRQEALDYHAQGRPGKIQVSPTKPFKNQRDLSLAYTPGVAEPCREIAERPEEVYSYTAKGNLVAVVTNGTAVLGLGNIGPLAGKPVMEGKGILFKAFADIDVFDLEVGSERPDDVIRFCQLLEPTVGGINLEDIRSPDCFYIEETLRATLSIPVFHDDQHGTAIISGAALLNALELLKKEIAQIKVVFAGAGAAAIATAEHYVRLGVQRDHIVMCDHKGVVHGERADLDQYIYMLVFPQQTYFFADCTVNIEPDAETLAEIASATASFVWRLGIEPRVAMLSFSNFGSVKHPSVDKVRRAVALLHEREPALQVDGEMQADTAVVERILTKTYPFAKLRSPANVLIFPDLDAANIAYKLLNRIGGADAIGPILVGMAQPVHILQRGAEVNDIVNMAVIAAVDAQEHGPRPRA